MDIVFAQIADYANVSREGKLNLMGVFDAVNANTFPTVHPQMHLVIRFELSRHEKGKTHDVEIQFVDEDGKKLFTISSQVGIPANAAVATTTIHSDQIIAINGLLLPKAGNYQFVILIDKNHVKNKEVRLIARQIPAPATK